MGNFADSSELWQSVPWEWCRKTALMEPNGAGGGGGGERRWSAVLPVPDGDGVPTVTNDTNDGSPRTGRHNFSLPPGPGAGRPSSAARKRRGDAGEHDGTCGGIDPTRRTPRRHDNVTAAPAPQQCYGTTQWRIQRHSVRGWPSSTMVFLSKPDPNNPCSVTDFDRFISRLPIFSNCLGSPNSQVGA